MECNIDARGKAARLVAGIATLVLGLAFIGNNASGFTGYEVPIPVILAVFGGAAFTIFEAWQGWCVIRAMGFKTRL